MEVKVSEVLKSEAKAKLRELKQRLKAGEIKFDEYAKGKRLLKPLIVRK